MGELTKMEEVKDLIITLRGQDVLLDRDVATIYGVQTREVTQAVRNNPVKFPYGYLFELDKYEREEVVKKFDHLKSLKYRAATPVAFTERGLYMLATILKSPKAVQATIAIIDTFTQVREMARKMEEVQHATSPEAQKKILQESGEMMADVIGHSLSTSATETEIALNFALVKIRHIVRRDKE